MSHDDVLDFLRFFTGGDEDVIRLLVRANPWVDDEPQCRVDELRSAVAAGRARGASGFIDALTVAVGHGEASQSLVYPVLRHHGWGFSR